MDNMNFFKSVFLFLPLLIGGNSAIAEVQPDTLVARIISPQNMDFEATEISISIEVLCGVEGYWELRNYNNEGGDEVVLCEGTGSINSATPAYTGVLPFGYQHVTLDLWYGEERRTDAVDIICTADMLPGWPFSIDLPEEGSFHIMPEMVHGKLAYPVSNPSIIEGPNDQLNLLDGSALNVPGFPIDLDELDVDLIP